MYVTVTSPPDPVLDLPRVKQHLRVDADDEDALINGYLAAASGWLDGPGGWLGRCIGEQTLELVADGLEGLRLPYPPVIEVQTISYTDPSGAIQVLPASDYHLYPDGCLWTKPVAVHDRPGAVRVLYKAGYPKSAEGESTVPEAILQAMLLLVGQWYRSRENVVTGTIAATLPFSVDALLSSYRVWR